MFGFFTVNHSITQSRAVFLWTLLDFTTTMLTDSHQDLVQLEKVYILLVNIAMLLRRLQMTTEQGQIFNV